MKMPFMPSGDLTATEAYNLLVADLYDELGAEVVESEEGQKVLAYFAERLE